MKCKKGAKKKNVIFPQQKITAKNKIRKSNKKLRNET